MKTWKRAVCIVGTRPEIQRSLPVLEELKHSRREAFILYAPQRRDPDGLEMLNQSTISHTVLASVFKNFPPYSVHTVMTALESELLHLEPDAIIIAGDTTTAVAACLLGQKHNIPIIKIGAGFRMGNFNAPEEKNDILTDHLSSLLFCFSETARQNLLREGVPEKASIVSGSTLIGPLHEQLRSRTHKITPADPILVSIHRKETLEHTKLISALFVVLKEQDRNSIFIAHQESATSISVKTKKIYVEPEPLHAGDFLKRLSKSYAVITDSNTVAEEACYLGIPCITLANQTNRGETIAIGANYLAPLSNDLEVFKKKLHQTLGKIRLQKRDWKFPYGDLRTTKMIANHIANKIS